MSNSARDIDRLKYHVKQLIKDNSHREVTPQTKYKTSGIYMIYIENFTDDKVVPIYIGQSKDIQRRYKQHYSEILALNRLSYDEYKYYYFGMSTLN
ncbi:hypothetical protein ACA29_05080 [Lederbergia galactosidilytica]|uniref:GIY-YIG domain-containing protein n=1 Tax=Lederbergia galactosidilytica TaxID=217031 RepID=A0A0Q9Y4J1_9BACI|nr:hypothetical protein ACA29_05080 [Lederbergia galactosidilytica]